MKKKFCFFGIVLMVMALVMLLVPGIVFADEATEVNVNWDGAGFVGTIVNTGDAETDFSTVGNYIKGHFKAIDANNNPYSYGVDNFTTQLMANVTDGYIMSETDRLTSKVSMYGDPGQYTYSLLSVSDGAGSMAIGTVSNFAAMKDCTYKNQLPGGHNMVVDANYYILQRFVQASDGDSGAFQAIGNGQATLDSMSSDMYATGVRFGHGCGCYTDASFTATGASGHVEITGSGGNLVKFEGLGMQSGGGSLSIIADWVNSFNISDYSLTAN